MKLINVLITVLIIATLTQAYVLFMQSKQIKDNGSLLQKVSLNTTNEKDSDTIAFPKVDRVRGVAAHLLLRGGDLNTETLKHLSEVEQDIVADVLRSDFYLNMSTYSDDSVMLKIVDELTIKLYDEWLITFDDAKAPLRNKFPRYPFLAIDNEIIPYPECDDKKLPALWWVKASRNNVKWPNEPIILEDNANKRWMIKFNDSLPIDPLSMDKRLLLLAGCN